MKKLFNISSLLAILSLVIGLIKYTDLRDRIYLAAMLLGFVAVFSGLAYLVNKKE